MNTRNILDKLAKLYNLDSEIDAKVLDTDNDGMEDDTIILAHERYGTVANEAIGRFFFVEADNGTKVFVNTISYVNVKDINMIPYICAELAIENNTLPMGNLAYDEDNNEVTFSTKIIIPDTLSDEEAYDECNACMGFTISIGKRFAEKYVQMANMRGAEWI